LLKQDRAGKMWVENLVWWFGFNIDKIIAAHGGWSIK
jgi:hypothetical protein